MCLKSTTDLFKETKLYMLSIDAISTFICTYPLLINQFSTVEYVNKEYFEQNLNSVERDFMKLTTRKVYGIKQFFKNSKK